ncbi:MAG: carboxypeptidase regulatory-like domain-containing protein [Acidobacteriota bacterium]
MRKLAICLLPVLLCLATSVAIAQTITGSITGTVTDPSGAVVPAARVVATNTGTNVTFNGITNTAGVYNFVFLPVGSYNVSVESQGFKKASFGPFALEVNQIARVDVKLEVGDATQTVEITAAAPILQTESTATGDTITSTKLTSLPLNGRNFATLTLLIPGAISTAPAAMNTSGRFQGSGSRPQVNGNREQTNNFLLDGVDVNDSIDNRIGYNPNVDALEEVKVITGNGGGEFGNVGGAIVNMTLRSGTNAFHGNLFEFLRNDKLDANGFFPNRQKTARNAFRRNIFGGTLGGPIVKNKAFFFIDYEGTEQRSSGPATASVAPEAWRHGNLSGVAQSVKDPLTGEQFPGNIIPESRIVNPVALYLYSHPDIYPLPNKSGTGGFGVTGNYAARTANKLSNHQADAKVDYRPTDDDLISGRWSIGRYERFDNMQPLPTTMTGGTEGPTTSATVSWTRTFSARIVNELRIAYSRIGIDDTVNDWSGKLGMNGNQNAGIPGGQPIAGMSAISLSGGALTTIGSAATIGSTMDNKYQLGDNLTYSLGPHLLKMGGQLIRFQQNRYYAGNNGALGTFTYNGSYSGLDYADFLLNQLAIKGRGALTGKWGHRHWRNALFFQDDWKVKQNLTLNLGMRWEYISPIYEVADRQLNINTFTGELMYAGKDGNSRALYDPYYKQFMPRIGVAWTPGAFHQKLVIRAGYAFTSFLEGTGANLRLTMNPPFFTESNVTYGTVPGDISTGFSDVIEGLTFDSPLAAAASLQGRAWDLNLRPQFNNQFNFAVEYQADQATSVSVAYVGQRGTHLVVPHEANQPMPGTGDPSTWAPLNSRRPLATALPALNNVALTESSGTMAYNALQASLRHRLSGGLELIGQYTLSKTLTDNLGYYGCGSVNAEGAYWQNAYDRHGNYGPACFDALHNFSLGGVFNLPAGKGKKWGAGWNRPLDLILGGWNINYFLSAHSGFPVTIMASAHQTNTLQSVRGNVRANRYRELSTPSDFSVDRYFGPVDASTFCASGVDNGTCAYGVPAKGMFGNSGVGTQRAPSFFNLDASIGKRFNVTESKGIDFRAEFFNLMNHASFGPPGRDITNLGTFGQITSQITQPRNIQFGLKYYF